MLLAAVSALAELPSWVRNTEAGSALEAVFVRMMAMPRGAVAFRRPPRETRPALGELIQSQPHNAELYSLRAREDEQQLDFAAAEEDWKANLQYSSDKAQAEFALADFYHRRLRPQDEIRTLALVANAPPLDAEKLTPQAEQRSWLAFERIFGIIQAQGLAKESSIAQYRAWIARYPQEPSLYARFLQFLVAQKEFPAAADLIVSYRKQFPADPVFPVKARAMVEYRQGSVGEGLSVYEKSFEPLWDPELVKSYFDLLRDTQNLRKFRDNAQAALDADPDDLNATARLFYYYQQQGKTDASQQAITQYRLHKEASKSAWTAQQLFTCARLLEDIHSYPESARYYFALYNANGSVSNHENAQEVAIAGLTSILLTAPETPITLGSGDLSMYRDIATMDQGPGYLNGILSLILNTTHPAEKYSEEEQRAAPYFHRARAAALLTLIDEKYPASLHRAALHAQLLEFYSNSGESDAVIQGGREFLANFPNAAERTSVALLMADAYARKNDTQDEFAIYDSVLKELAAKAQNVPLGDSNAGMAAPNYATPATDTESDHDDAAESGDSEQDTEGQGEAAQSRHRAAQSLQLGVGTAPVQASGPRSPEYARVLERYLARLAETKQVLPALVVLRREIDRNPDDPGLYERLATFVEQNQLGSEEEEVYRRAMARFQDKSWYDKLARFYLRHRHEDQFEQLTRAAIKTFDGSDLESYFDHVVGGSPAIYLRLNLYAHQRFPHNPVFVRNLLSAYQAPATHDSVAWEALLREHWFEDTYLRNEFFEFLAGNGKLNSELAAIRQSAPDAAAWEKNPAAATFLAYGDLWRSHFESGAPVLKALAEQYPAEREIGDAAASVYRSLAYFEPADTEIAVKIENNLLQANPGDSSLLARIGDTYADRNLFAKAAPYWERIPQVAPGQSSGYLDAATIYWDYFDFGNSLRLLAKGREQLGDPNLYDYEEAAIYENEREYPKAIEQYVKGALNAPGSSAEARLLTLARRPKFRDLVEQSTATIAAGANPSMTAVKLRVSVLEAQDRKQEMAAFLDRAVSGTTSIEEAEDLETIAEQKSLEEVRRHALEKQVSLTNDPVTRLQLRYSLVQLYESHKDFANAQKNVEALYRENPKILGVVRSTVDFYWRMRLQSQAIEVLRHAAKDAYPELAQQFTFEAARKLTEAKRYAEARELLAGLLKDSPNNGEYLAAMADAYAQAGDDPGLQQFYLTQIASLHENITLTADARKAQIATLRRGLIPSLTRMKNYAGAVDQYIELINKYPEDEALVTEAALYAQRNDRRQQLENFYAKTVANSPRDYRWSMVLARIQTNLEEYPAAIDTYAKAIAIRPDRTDLLIARAGLEERLMRFDEAASDYERIYQLSYKAPQWMESVATVRARQGKTEDTIAALEAALITGRPENAANYFEVALRLEGWGMLGPARLYAERGVKTAGADLLANSDYLAGLKAYVRIMTRLRQYPEACDTLQKGLSDASASLPVLKQQIAKQGMAGITDSEWRESTRRMRLASARNGVSAALQEMGSAENAWFTPEERLTFAHFAEARRASMNFDDVEKFAVPLAQSGGLAYQEALWRFQLAMERRSTNLDGTNLARYVELQRQRGLYSELGQNLEKYAPAAQVLHLNTALVQAADAYRSAGDEANEMRVLQGISLNFLDDGHRQRLFQLLLARDPQALVQIASTWNAQWGEQAASYIAEHGGTALSHQMVEARGQARPAVWNSSYNALIGLYYAEGSSQVHNDFVTVLGDETIGARIGKAVDRDRQLAGGVWFYYGARYGEYLATTKSGDAEDYLPAALEQSPTSSANYLALANYYASSGDMKHAIIDYQHTLELSPHRPDVLDSLALAYYRDGDRAAALQQWKQALTVLAKQVDDAHVPEAFWADFGRTCDQLAAHGMFTALKPEVEAIVRNYLRHNGNYRTNAVLHSIYTASGGSKEAAEWLVSLSSSASEPAQVLGDVADASWIPRADRGIIYQSVLQQKREAADKLFGIEHDSAEQDLAAWQVRWIEYLVGDHRFAEAAMAIDALPKNTREARSGAVVPLELQLAAKLGTLEGKIEAYRSDPATAPANDLLKTAAHAIFESGDKRSARKLLEFAFARAIADHQLDAANFLGLAEIRIADGDTPGAMELLHRLVLAVGAPLENLEPAAALLEKTGHYVEAVEFLDSLVKSAPWEASYRLRLAKARLAAKQNGETSARESLAAIAADPQNAYSLRVQAATALGGGAHKTLGSGELDLLADASGKIATEAADKFYFYEARVRAAENASDAAIKIRLLSHCITDFPHRDEARVPLFRAAAAARSDEFAIGVIDPLLQRQYLRQTVNTDDTEEIVSSRDEEDSENGASSSVIATTKMDRAQQAEVAQVVGDVLMRLGRTEDATGYYQWARQMEKPLAERKALALKISAAKAEIRRRRENAMRAPVFHEALEQDRLVKPRLLARATPAAAAKGAVKP